MSGPGITGRPRSTSPILLSAFHVPNSYNSCFACVDFASSLRITRTFCHWIPSVAQRSAMGEQIRVGIIGCGWPGAAHARGYAAAGGFKVAAVADLIPDRRRKLMAEFQIPREYSDGKDLLKDKE